MHPKWDTPYVYCIREKTGEASAQFWTNGAVKVQIMSLEMKRKMAYYHGHPERSSPGNPGEVVRQHRHRILIPHTRALACESG